MKSALNARLHVGWTDNEVCLAANINRGSIQWLITRIKSENRDE